MQFGFSLWKKKNDETETKKKIQLKKKKEKHFWEMSKLKGGMGSSAGSVRGPSAGQAVMPEAGGVGEALVGRGPLGPGEEEAGLSLRGSSPAEPRLRQAPAAGTAGASGWEPGVLAQPRAPVSGSLRCAAAPELPQGRSCLAGHA